LKEFYNLTKTLDHIFSPSSFILPLLLCISWAFKQNRLQRRNSLFCATGRDRSTS